MVDLSSVRCTNGHTLPVGKAASKFCVICGAPMTVTCPEGHQVRIARFCSVCGAPLSVPGEPGDKGSRAGGEGADEAGPPADAPAAGSGADGERAAASEPVHGRSSRNRLIIFGSALLVLLLAGGVYFAVTELAGSQSGKPTATLTPAPPPTSTSVSSPPSAITPSSSPTPSLPPTLSTTTTITATSTSTTTAPATGTAAVPAPISDPAQVVTAYYAAINAHDYAQAWALGGKNVAGGSYTAFVQGFATTASDALTVVSVANDTVTVLLDATHTDGTHLHFAGTYTVRGGVIVGASIQQTAG